MDKNQKKDRLVVERILMKESDKEKDTFVGRIKIYGEEKEFKGEVVVLAKNLPEVGKYKVVARPMKSGKGWIVEEWEKAYDIIEVRSVDDEVVFCVNGRQDKLRMDDGYSIPLFFNPAKYFPPEIVLKNIKKKLGYLTLPVDFSFANLSQDFLEKCGEVEKSYKKKIRRTVQSVDDEVDVSALKMKYGKD